MAIDNERLKLQEKINQLLEGEERTLLSIFDTQKGIFSTQRRLNDLNKDYGEINKKIQNLRSKILEGDENTLKANENLLKIYGQQRKEIEKQKQGLENLKNIREGIVNSARNYFTYLMQSDKAIRQTILNLGLSGNKANILRKNFEDSAVELAYLGSNLQELSEIQTTYSELTGRQTLLYKEAAIAVTRIAKGTALGVQGAGELIGKFELVGTNAEDTAKTVQNIVDSSEKFGLNSNKILKSMNANFKRLATYGFKTGVAGMSDMAMYSEKFKINMESTLNAADKARTLEGAVDLASKLQVLGGEFAKTDPFKMLYESRNDPKKFMQTINEMTKGMATLRKTSEGFEFDLASPQSRDILAKAAEALGMSTEELAEQAIQMAKIQEMRRQMSSSGILNPEDRSVIEGMAQFEKGTGKFYVMIGDQKKELSKLSKAEIEGLKSQKTSLEERAKAAQTFNEQLAATVEGLKAALLPSLRGINAVLDTISPILKGINDIFDSIPDWGKSAMKWVAALSIVFVAGKKFWDLTTKSFSAIKTSAQMIGSYFSKKEITGTIQSTVGEAAKEKVKEKAKGKMKDIAGGNIKQMPSGGISENVTNEMKKINPKTILAMGAAFVALGAGIWLAAKGISGLAESIKELNVDQMALLKDVVSYLGIGFGVLSVAVIALGFAASSAALPMLGFGGAILMIGAGIGIAAAGIGFMADGMTKLMQNISIEKMKAVTLAFAGIAGSLALLSTTGIIGVTALTAALTVMALYSGTLEKVGTAFSGIAAVMAGDNTNFIETAKAIKTIAEADVSNNNFISQLSDLFSKPLKVEFDRKEVALNVNTIINVDGRTMASALSRQIVDVTVAAQKGRG